MNQTELKAYADAKAMEKYPHVKVNVSNPHYLDPIEANGFSASKREIYTQAIIDTYEERERVNEELLDLVTEVLKVWNEDGDNGEIQMKTPIAWYRVIRKAELAKAIIDAYEEPKNDAVEFLEWYLKNVLQDNTKIWNERNFLGYKKIYELFKQSKKK
jgi:hypothetical protein